MVVEAIGGTGKSALTWRWAQDRAPTVIDGLAGRLWWSFYEGSASMTRFLQELLAYTSGRPMNQIRQLERASLADQVITELRRRPYLIVLDGFERLLSAYHQFDPSKLRDEEVEPDKRSLIEPHAEEIVRQLTTAGPSKILVSTRLMPVALNSRFGALMPGVRHLRLPGLSDSDTRALLARLGVNGSHTAIARFFGSLGNHPLLVGIVAGLVRDYRAEPGGFDRWLADPTAGAALSVPDLNLTQRRTHILAAGLDGLPAGSQRLLGWISVLPGTVRWETMFAINPFRPEPPAPIEPDLSTLGTLPDPFEYLPPQFDSALPRPVSYVEPPEPADQETGDDDWEDYQRQLQERDAAAGGSAPKPSRPPGNSSPPGRHRNRSCAPSRSSTRRSKISKTVGCCGGTVPPTPMTCTPSSAPTSTTSSGTPTGYRPTTGSATTSRPCPPKTPAGRLASRTSPRPSSSSAP